MNADARPRPGPALMTPKGHPTTVAMIMSLGVACALVLPGLGTSGLWYPAETRIAEAAAALAAGDARWSDGLTLPALAWLPALALRWLPAGEGVVRLPGALVALGSLVATFAAARVWFGPRAGWLAVLALAGFPWFTLSARQLTSDQIVGFAAVLGVAGLGLLMNGRRQMAIGIAVIIVSGVVATGAGGVLVVLLPLLLAAAASALIAERPGWGRTAIGMGAVAAALGLAMAIWPARAGDVSWALGGRPPVPPASPPTFEALIEPLGFGLFPLGVLGFLALYDLRGADVRGRHGALLLLFSAGFGLAASTLQLHQLGQSRVAIVPIVAVALGAWLDERLQARQDNRLLAFVGSVGALLLTRDLMLVPEGLLSAHLPARFAWPPASSIAALVCGLGISSVVGAALFLAGPAGSWGPRLSARALGATVLVAAPIVGSFVLAHRVVPRLSLHLSQSELGGRFSSLAAPGTPLGLHGLEVAELGPFRRPRLVPLPGADAVVAHLAAPTPAYALVARNQLAALDAAFGEARVAYVVLDDTSSRALLLGNGPGDESRNPLAPVRWRSGLLTPAPAPTDAPTLAAFGHSVELVAIELPARARRGGALPLTLVFRVTGHLPADHKIFVHVEGAGNRLSGDHPPAGDHFATQHWRPGDFIRDTTAIDVPRVGTSAGRYQVAVGFWPGGDTPVRLPLDVAAGSPVTSDGHDRAIIGFVDID